jgi:hypothetical protein
LGPLVGRVVVGGAVVVAVSSLGSGPKVTEGDVGEVERVAVARPFDSSPVQAATVTERTRTVRLAAALRWTVNAVDTANLPDRSTGASELMNAVEVGSLSSAPLRMGGNSSSAALESRT